MHNIPDVAYTRRQIWDITEPTPIPKGVMVQIQDYDSCADLYFVEWHGRIYAATPDELML